MANKLENHPVSKLMNPKLRINEEVFCACNNLECDGHCRRIHLIKHAVVSNETGRPRKVAPTGDYCSAAFNKNNRERVRTARSKTEDTYENWQDWV